jgi:hypothetical protein
MSVHPQADNFPRCSAQAKVLPVSSRRCAAGVEVAGLHGFQRAVTFALDDDPAVIAARVQETMED